VHPYLLQFRVPYLGLFRLPSYGFMVMCGFLLCLWVGQKRARRMGLDPTAFFDLAVYALLGGIIGARLFYVLDNWGEFADQPLGIFAFWRGGLAFFGGLMGGAAVLLYALASRRMPLRLTLDLVTSLVPLGHAFGRIGCFLNGCCFGKVTDSWIGIRFPRVLSPGALRGSLLNVGQEHIVNPVFQHQVAIGWPIEEFKHIQRTFSPEFVEQFKHATVFMGDRYLLKPTEQWTLPVHPTELYAVGYNLLIFAILSYMLRRRWRAGEVAWLYAMLYGTARYCQEFFRADNPPLAGLGGLTIFQALGAGLAVFGFVMFLRGRRRPSEPLPAPWQPSAGQESGPRAQKRVSRRGR